MCIFCQHYKKGGVENAAVGIWAKGLSFILCSYIFLIHIIEENGYIMLRGVRTITPEDKLLYYFSWANIIGAGVLLIFSLLGHFISKMCLRPIYFISFFVSLFLLSSAAYTTALCKNSSLQIAGIMDALKFHPDYMIFKKMDLQQVVQSAKNEGTELLPLKFDEENESDLSQKGKTETAVDPSKVKENAPVDTPDPIPLSVTDKTTVPGVTPDPIPLSDPDKATVPEDTEKPAETKQDYVKWFCNLLKNSKIMEKMKLTSSVNVDELENKLKTIQEKTGTAKGTHMTGEIEDVLIGMYDKMITSKEDFDLIDKVTTYAKSYPVLVPSVQKVEDFASKLKRMMHSYGGSVFQSQKMDLIKHENKIYVIYEKSITRIKQVQLQNPTPKIWDYISEDMKRRNLFMITSVLMFMSFIYIHKGATLTMESPASISLLYMPCMSYIITLACVFICCGISFFSLLGFIMFVFGILLIIFLIFSQCFCERIFKFLMGFLFLLIFIFSIIILYFIMANFNEGISVYLHYKENNFEDFYWLLLDTKTYEAFKKYILFFNGQILLIALCLCFFTIVYSLYCTFYSFCSAFRKKKKAVTFV